MCGYNVGIAFAQASQSMKFAFCLKLFVCYAGVNFPLNILFYISLYPFIYSNVFIDHNYVP